MQQYALRVRLLSRNRLPEKEASRSMKEEKGAKNRQGNCICMYIQTSYLVAFRHAQEPNRSQNLVFGCRSTAQGESSMISFARPAPLDSRIQHDAENNSRYLEPVIGSRRCFCPLYNRREAHRSSETFQSSPLKPTTNINNQHYKTTKHNFFFPTKK